MNNPPKPQTKAQEISVQVKNIIVGKIEAFTRSFLPVQEEELSSLEIYELKNKDEEKELQRKKALENLADFFISLTKGAEFLENSRDAINILGKIPNESSLELLKKIAQDPEKELKPETKKLVDEKFIIPRLKDGLENSEINRQYANEHIQLEAYRSLIKLKNNMELELDPEEQSYLEKHPEKF